MVEFDYPCPYTGKTTFSTVWSCLNCSRSAQLSLENIKEGGVISGRYMEIRGLQPGPGYALKIRAVVADCIADTNGDRDNEIQQTNECTVESDEVKVKVACKYRCKDGSCINRSGKIRCNWITECVDGSDELNCKCPGFLCGNNFCIESHQRCDGHVNCNDNSDEKGCPGCKRNQFRCASGKCISGKRACDRRVDCPDGSDELYCPYREHVCWPDKFKCYNGRCISSSRRCDRKPDCPQGEDEQNCDFQCQLNEYTCKDGGCVSQAALCDGNVDCLDGSDEIEHCHCYQLGEASCRSTGHCINRQKVCDGNFDCSDNSDETDCTRGQLVHRYGPRGNASHVYSTPGPDSLSGIQSQNIPDPRFESGKSDDASQAGPQQISSHRSADQTADPHTGKEGLARRPADGEDGLVSEPGGYSVAMTEPRTYSTVYSTVDAATVASTSASTTTHPPPHWLREVSVRVYPQEQTVDQGSDVVFQCRDEGLARAEVTWSRPGGQPWPVNTSQFRGRLEMAGVRRQDAGLYICTAEGWQGKEGGSVVASLTVT